LNRGVVVAAAVVITGLIGWLAFVLGSVGFDVRRYSMHEGRLARLLPLKPTSEQLTRGLEDEGTHLVAIAKGEAELRGAASTLAGPRAAAVFEKGARWPATRIFLAGDMVYFIYFDSVGVMRDFVCVSRPPGMPSRSPASPAPDPP
jgi:hypothetical protein